MQVVVREGEVITQPPKSSTLHDSTIGEASLGSILTYPDDADSTRVTITYESYSSRARSLKGGVMSCPVLPLYSRFIPSVPLSRLILLVPLPTSSRWRNHNRHNYLLLTLPQVLLTTFPSLHLPCSIPRYALVLFPFPLVPCSTFPFTLTDCLRTFHDPVYPPYS